RWLHHERRTRLRFSKFEPTSEKMVFVGYAPNADAYLLLDPETDEVTKERNLKVVEDIFPFCEVKEKCKCHQEENEKTKVGSSGTIMDLFIGGGLSSTSASSDGQIESPPPTASETVDGTANESAVPIGRVPESSCNEPVG